MRTRRPVCISQEEMNQPARGIEANPQRGVAISGTSIPPWTSSEANPDGSDLKNPDRTRPATMRKALLARRQADRLLLQP